MAKKFTADMVTDCLTEVHDILDLLEQIVRNEARKNPTAAIWTAVKQIENAKHVAWSAGSWVLQHNTKTTNPEAGN